MKVTLKINGEERSVDVASGTPLLWVLRDELNMTGTKFGCGVAQCGACTVHLNGSPTRSCSLPVDGLSGSEVTTIEGVEGPEADAVRAAWQDLDVPQCGYCQSGQIMSAVRLLKDKPEPTDDDIDSAII